MTKVPHITSKINGMKIPLLPHQGGILHRFAVPECQLVISGVSQESLAIKDSDTRMVIAESDPDPTPVPTAPTKSSRGRAEKETML